MAFLDIQPVNNGHVLVVPREHYESLLDVPEEIGLHLFRVTMRLANAVRLVSGCDAMNIVVNSGKAAGQDEPHYHVHIIPRREGDGFDIPLPFGGSAMPDRTLLDAYAARIGSALRDPMKTDARSSAATRPDTGAPDSEPRLGTPGDRQKDTSSGERPVALPVFDESESGTARAVRSTPDSARLWSEEGAHGELRSARFVDDEVQL